MSVDNTCHRPTFKKIYEMHATALRNFISYKSGNSGFSEDTVQEAFLRLWKKCADVPVSKAKSFLFTVANNLFLDHANHQKVVLKYKNVPQRDRTEESPQYLMEESEFKDRLEAAINDLSEGQRTVFLMNRIDKMKYREIAEALNISQKAVEKRMHKALLILRNRIGKV